MAPPLSGFHPVDLSAQVGAGGCLLDLFRKGGVPRLQFDDAGARIATFQRPHHTLKVGSGYGDGSGSGDGSGDGDGSGYGFGSGDGDGDGDGSGDG